MLEFYVRKLLELVMMSNWQTDYKLQMIDEIRKDYKYNPKEDSNE